MQSSSITKHEWAAGTPFARALGARIRRLREEHGMTQTEMGWPMTRAYVSLIESGQTLPSLPSLLWIAMRLDVDACTLLSSIAHRPRRYTGAHGSDVRRPSTGD
jgi:transcriptional regulator with XRE-family HTH domain